MRYLDLNLLGPANLFLVTFSTDRPTNRMCRADGPQPPCLWTCRGLVTGKVARLGDFLVIDRLVLDCHVDWRLVVELDSELGSDSIFLISFLFPSFSCMSAAVCPDNA